MTFDTALKMSIKVAIGFIRLVVVLMVLQCFITAFATPSSRDSSHTSINEKSLASILCSALLPETEEEKSGEENDKSFAVELADFSKNIAFLSKIHTPHFQSIVHEHFDHQPSLFTLFCVFII
jgi:hypothetical protein